MVGSKGSANHFCGFSHLRGCRANGAFALHMCVYVCNYNSLCFFQMRAGIPLAKINCDQEKNHPLAARYHVRGFPTLRIFKKMFDSDDKVIGTVSTLADATHTLLEHQNTISGGMPVTYAQVEATTLCV